jgi:hypothetical protein
MKKSTLIFRSPKGHAVHQLNEEALRSDAANYLGEQVILGFKCLGKRFPPGVETYLSPVLNCPLKETFTTDNGRLVNEAVKVDLGEPSESEFGEVPNYPVDYRYYESDIADAEKRGDTVLANEMRRLLAEAKAY